MTTRSGFWHWSTVRPIIKPSRFNCPRLQCFWKTRKRVIIPSISNRKSRFPTCPSTWPIPIRIREKSLPTFDSVRRCRWRSIVMKSMMSPCLDRELQSSTPASHHCLILLIRSGKATWSIIIQERQNPSWIKSVWKTMTVMASVSFQAVKNWFWTWISQPKASILKLWKWSAKTGRKLEFRPPLKKWHRMNTVPPNPPTNWMSECGVQASLWVS